MGELEISVVLPVYNGMKYLRASVESVLSQSFSQFEFLICDDASNDGSWEWLESIHDPRIRLFRNEANKGLFPTLNFLCRNASAKIIKLWTQDDIMNPDCLEETIAYHHKYPLISFSYSERQHIDEDGQFIPSNDLKDFTPESIPRSLHDKIALFTGSIAGNISNVTIVKGKLEEVGYFDESMTIAADFDMWVRLTKDYDIGKIKKPLIRLRSHSGQLSRSPQYYIRHLKEEKKIFNELMGRVDNGLREFGWSCIMQRKHPLYFSFMLQAVRRGEWKIVREFIRELSQNDNIILLSFRWLRLKLKRGFSKSVEQDNSFLFNGGQTT